MEKPSSLPYYQVSICHVGRPVSRDRWILAMEMEAGKPTHTVYFLLIL